MDVSVSYLPACTGIVADVDPRNLVLSEHLMINKEASSIDVFIDRIPTFRVDGGEIRYYPSISYDKF